VEIGDGFEEYIGDIKNRTLEYLYRQRMVVCNLVNVNQTEKGYIDDDRRTSQWAARHVVYSRFLVKSSFGTAVFRSHT